MLQPLLANCLYLVDIIGPYAADLLDRVRARPKVSGAAMKRLGPRSLAKIEAVIAEHRRTGTPLPRLDGPAVTTRLNKGWSPEDPLLNVFVNEVAQAAGIARVPSSQLALLRPTFQAAVADVGVAGLWGRHAELVPRVDTGEVVPWTEPLTSWQVRRHLAEHLLGACLVVVAAVSGMRHSELVHIEAGSRRPPESVPGGGYRYRLGSRLVKGQRFGGTPDEWVVLEQVDRAVALAERLSAAPTGTPLVRHTELRVGDEAPAGLVRPTVRPTPRARAGSRRSDPSADAAPHAGAATRPTPRRPARREDPSQTRVGRDHRGHLPGREGHKRCSVVRSSRRNNAITSTSPWLHSRSSRRGRYPPAPAHAT